MKKSLLVCVSILLLAAFAIGGTLAYLTDTDSAVNTMTVGNVKIKQNEQERVGKDKLKDYEDKPILPAVYEGDSIPWAGEDDWVEPGKQAWKVVADAPNVIDKFVTVTNTGNTDAYVRTVFAFESNPLADDGSDDKMIHIVYNGENVPGEIVWDYNIGMIKIGGTDYQLAVATYKNILPAGKTTIPSLKQIYLDRKADNADLAKYGAEYKVYAVSQAVQASGFDNVNAAFEETFGKITTSNHPWVSVWDGVTADTTWYDPSAAEYTLDSAEDVAGFAKLVNDGISFSGKTLKLASDIDLGGVEWLPIGQTGGYYANTYFQGTFDGQGYTISNMKITQTNEGEHYAAGFFGFIDAASATIRNVNFDKAEVNGHHWTAVVAGYVTGEVSGCTVTNSSVVCTHANNEACGDKAGIIAGYVNDNGNTITNNTVKNCSVTAGRDAGAVIGAANSSTNTISGNTFENVTVTAASGCTGANVNAAEIGRNLG